MALTSIQAVGRYLKYCMQLIKMHMHHNLAHHNQLMKVQLSVAAKHNELRAPGINTLPDPPAANLLYHTSLHALNFLAATFRRRRENTMAIIVCLRGSHGPQWSLHPWDFAIRRKKGSWRGRYYAFLDFVLLVVFDIITQNSFVESG